MLYGLTRITAIRTECKRASCRTSDFYLNTPTLTHKKIYFILFGGKYYYTYLSPPSIYAFSPNFTLCKLLLNFKTTPSIVNHTIILLTTCVCRTSDVSKGCDIFI